MSKIIVQNQRGNFDFSFSLLLQFIDVCPDQLWVKKFGGWPIWQQVYHALTAIDFFVSTPDGEPLKGLVPQEVSSLSVQGDQPVSKDEVKEFAQLAKAAADNYLNSLSDADLGTRAEGASKRMQRETSHATILIFLTGHILYHLGTCDAALREQGLKGVF